MRRLAAALALCSLPTLVAAHGINGHVHVTGWAIETLPPGELRAFFEDSTLRDATQAGAFFPDSGYAIGDAYGEMAHWEPFINTYVNWIIETYGPNYESDEGKRHIAFMMGAASHGLQDELFDTLFLRFLVQEDGEDQDAADPGTDSFLFTDGILEFKPPFFVPDTGLQEVFRRAHDYEPDQTSIRAGMQRVKFFVIDHFDAVAPGLDAQHRPSLPWGSTHYLDPEIPGSLTSEIEPTAAYMLALWERLHGRFGPQAIVSHVFPTATRRLRSVDASRVDSRIDVVFGIGTIVRSLNTDTVKLIGPADHEVPLSVQHTRWSGNPEDSTRQVLLVPLESLLPDSEYEVRILPGVEMQDGQLTTDLFSYRFLTPCPAEGECSPGPDVLPLDPPRVPYPPTPDAALPDAAAGPADAAVSPDAAAPPNDSEPPREGGSSPATTPPDAVPSAPSPTDAATGPADAAINPTAPPASTVGGGDCRGAPGRPSAPLAMLLACLCALPMLRRRRGLRRP